MTTNNKLQGAVYEEDDILELDADKVFLVTDAFSKVEMYLQSDTKLGYVKLNAPGLYTFQLPDHPDGDRESTTHNEEDNAAVTDRWAKEGVQEIDLIKAEDEAQLGLIQRDESTGELYILMPIEMDVLLQPDDTGNLETNLSAADSSTTIADIDEDALHAEQAEGGEVLCESELCRFVVPQMSLKFRLTLQVGDLNETGLDPTEDNV